MLGGESANAYNEETFGPEGIACHQLEIVPPQKKSICVSRSFSQRLTDIDSVREALLTHAARAGEKLRKNRLLAKRMLVFLHTSPFAVDEPFYCGKLPFSLPAWTNDTFDISHYALFALERIFVPDHRYIKCGIELSELVEQGAENLEQFAVPRKERSLALMKAMDELNHRMGRNTVVLAGSGLRRHWFTKRDLRSPRYTTSMEELLVACAH